jgi:hypothetical protein
LPGSLGAAAWIAKLAFVALLARGWLSGELRRSALIVFVALGIAAWIGLPHLGGGENYVTTALAAVDIALVFAVFKGDVRIG